MRKNILFVGNPGAGKSCLLNSLIGQAVFKSGLSFGTGLTSFLQTAEADGFHYLDTPGLDDEEKRQQAADAIAQALRSPGTHKLFFVFHLQMGRAKPSDLQLLKVVLEAIDVSIFVPFYIIFNQASQTELRLLSGKPAAEQLISHFFFRGIAAEKVVGYRSNLFIPRIECMDGEEDVLMPDDCEHLQQLKTFVASALAVDIPSQNVRDLDVRDWEKQARDLEAQLAQQKAEFEAQMQKLKEEQAAKDRRLEELESALKKMEDDMKKVGEQHQQQLMENNDKLKSLEEQLRDFKRQDEHNRNKLRSVLNFSPGQPGTTNVSNLVKDLHNERPAVQEKAAQELRLLVTDESTHAEMVSAGAIPALVAVLCRGTPRAKKKACFVLWQLAIAEDTDNQVAISQAGAIPQLVNILATSTAADCQKNAAMVLCSIASVVDNVLTMIHAGCLPPLLQVMSKNTNGAKEAAVAAVSMMLWTCCSNSINEDDKETCCRAVLRAGTVERLVQVLNSSCSVQTKTMACMSLNILAWTRHIVSIELSRLDGTKYLARFLTNNPEPDVEDTVCSVLANISYDVPGVRFEVACTPGVLHHIFRILRTRRLKVAAAELLMVLGLDDTVRKVLLNHQPFELLSEALESDVPENRLHAAGALCVLYKSNAEKFQKYVRILADFAASTDYYFVANGLAILAAIASASEDHALALVQNGTWKVAQQQFEKQVAKKEAAYALVSISKGTLPYFQARSGISDEELKADIEALHDLVVNVYGPEVRRDLDQQMEDWFHIFDEDGNGALSQREVMSILMSFNMSKQRAKELWKAMDADGNGVISMQEFKSFWKR